MFSRSSRATAEASVIILANQGPRGKLVRRLLADRRPIWPLHLMAWHIAFLPRLEAVPALIRFFCRLPNAKVNRQKCVAFLSALNDQLGPVNGARYFSLRSYNYTWLTENFDIGGPTSSQQCGANKGVHASGAFDGIYFVRAR